MSDSEIDQETESNLLDVNKQKSPSVLEINTGTRTTNSEEVTNSDLLSFFKTYMNNKLSGMEKNFNDTTHSLAKKVKKSENSFKFKGNQIQFELNSDVVDNIETAVNCIEKKRYKRALDVLEDSTALLRKRNKLIRIADKSEGGWQTVNEYLSDEVASDSEDEKRIRAADNRALRKIKASKLEKKGNRKRPAEAAGSSSQSAVGHSFQFPPFVQGASGTEPKLNKGKEKASVSTVVDLAIGQENAVKHQVVTREAEQRSKIHQETYQVQEYDINDSDFILSVIEDGYEIPLRTQPRSVILRNNRSALDNSEFVQKAILNLVQGNLVREVSSRPHVVNPLTVAINAKGKHRLVLDLRHVNKQVIVNKIKFEDWKVAKQYVTLDSFGFSFDLKSGYHHLDIYYPHQKYLGFSWKFGECVKYFVFTVLPFGLKSSGYIFIKVLRPLVSSWRKKGIKIVVYLDDGFSTAQDKQMSIEHAKIVKADIIASGFVPNKDKSVWIPAQNIHWLGFVWDLVNCVLKIPKEKISDIIDLANIILSSSRKIKIRLMAKFCGKVISLSPAIGNVTQIMTRAIYYVINQRTYWDQTVDISTSHECIREVVFWKNNLGSLDLQPLITEKTEFCIYTDASNSGAAGYIQNTSYVMNKVWLQFEKNKSSTWREVKAIELCLITFSHLLENSTVTFYTDNSNAVSIIEKGSKAQDLQDLALSIFNCCLKFKICIHVVWIPRELNEQADLLSGIIDIDDWAVSITFFQFIDSLWGPHTVDRFANMNNAKTAKFNSLYWNPGTIAIDAFSCNWGNENNWLVPPVSIASRVINHLVKCKTVGTLIVPRWPSSPFWPLLFDADLIYKSYVKDVLEFYEPAKIFVAGNNENSLFARGDFVGSVLAIRLDSSNM